MVPALPQPVPHRPNIYSVLPMPTRQLSLGEKITRSYLALTDRAPRAPESPSSEQVPSVLLRHMADASYVETLLAVRFPASLPPAM